MKLLNGYQQLGDWHVMRDGVVWQFPAPWSKTDQPTTLATEITQLNEAVLTVPRADGSYVYLHIGADDELLYVGSTSSPLGRLANHIANRKKSPWFGDVVDIVWLRCADARTASSVESSFIEHLCPRYNKQGKRVPQRVERCLDQLEDVDVRLLVSTSRSEHLDDTLAAIEGAVA